MKALIKYMLQDLIRSNRYFMPVMSYGIFVLWLYSLRPNPVLESYSLTAGVLFAAGVWFGQLLEGVEPSRQLELTALHAGGFARYAKARAGVCCLVGMALTLWAVLVPVLLRAFDAPAGAGGILMGLYSHQAAFLLGCGLAWCANLWFGKLQSAGLSLLVTALSFAAGGIGGQLPEWLGWLIWALPPVYPLMRGMLGFERLGGGQLLLFLYPLVYAVVMYGLIVWRFSRYEAGS